MDGVLQVDARGTSSAVDPSSSGAMDGAAAAAPAKSRVPSPLNKKLDLMVKSDWKKYNKQSRKENKRRTRRDLRCRAMVREKEAPS